jgi:conjugative relaxase-like TrwC/TraI family protein
MSLHKLTARDGYTYLTRQVAAQDATDRGRAGLAEYYDEWGESPGRWLGAGLDGLGTKAGAVVFEAQMVSLFGTGRHPNAVSLAAAVAAAGGTAVHASSAGALGRPFNVYPTGGSAFQAEIAREFREFNLARRERPSAAIPAGERARIRTRVATRLFIEEQGRGPVDVRELSGFIARASRPASSAVAGYDLTFSPVKSVSTLWALASPDVASAIERAHRAAVADTVGWLEREAGFTRVGGGARQVSVRGLVAAAFTHRDSRAGDPDLHTQVAVSNKVQTLDGRWLALDGRVLFKANVAASERYDTRLEAELVDRLGLRFIDRETRPGKRPVREVAGVSPMLARWWSTRRRVIEARRTALAEQFQTVHGRTPTPVEAIALAQQATLETRDPKHEPRSETEQRAAWRRQASGLLGGRLEVDAMIARALDPRPAPARPARLTDGWVAGTAEQAVRALEGSRATWQSWHVRAEAERQARAANIPIGDLDAAVDAVVAHTLEQMSVRLGEPDPITEPAALRRPDGTSVYQVHRSTRYTSTRVLAAEQSLLATARTGGGRAVDRVRVGIAVTEAAANGTVLSRSQAAMVTALATSGARLQLALAPAGTGKTTTVTVLARAWSNADGYVLGLAPSAQAAGGLGAAIGGHADTLAKLTWTLTRVPPPQWPTWVQRVGPRTLVVIDEAGQAGTTDLALEVDFITSRGGSVRLVGDDQQLASVAAGGILRDLAHTVGAVTLTDVHRFANAAEAAATLASPSATATPPRSASTPTTTASTSATSVSPPTRPTERGSPTGPPDRPDPGRRSASRRRLAVGRIRRCPRRQLRLNLRLKTDLRSAAS